MVQCHDAICTLSSIIGAILNKALNTLCNLMSLLVILQLIFTERWLFVLAYWYAGRPVQCIAFTMTVHALQCLASVLCDLLNAVFPYCSVSLHVLCLPVFYGANVMKPEF